MISAVDYEDTLYPISTFIALAHTSFITREYPLFIIGKGLYHQDSMGFLEKLRNLPKVEEVKTEIILN